MSGAPHISHDDHHRALVNRLSSEVTAKRPLWPVGTRLGLWAALEMGVLVWTTSHTTNSFVAKLSHPVYIIEIALFATAAIIAAALALKSAVPGRRLSASEAMMAAALVLAGTIIVATARPIDTSNPLSDFMRIGLRCARETTILGALPWIALWWLVRRGASVNGWLSGLLVGSGSLFFSFALMRLVCPIDEPLHLLTWHLLPALILVALSAVAGSIWLRFRPNTTGGA